MKLIFPKHILLASFALGVVADPSMVHVADASFRVGDSIFAGSTPQGVFSYTPVLSGTFNLTNNPNSKTSPLYGRVVPGGSDYAQIRTDGSFAPSVSIGFQGINDPSFFHFTSYGYVQPGVTLSGNTTIDYGSVEAYQVIRINTNSTQNAWLNAAALVAQESLVVVNGGLQYVNLKVFRIITKDH